MNTNQTPRKDDDDAGYITEETRVASITSPVATLPGPSGSIIVDPLPEGCTAALEVTQGRQCGSRFKFTRPLTIIGRIADVADVVILDSSVSRHHAAIGYRNATYTLYDLGSTNGTFVNDDPVQERRLTHGAQIRVGDTVLTFWEQ